jgi:hypothetical protein
MTTNYYFKGFYKNDKKNGQGIIQVKSDFNESLGIEGLLDLQTEKYIAINEGRI